MAKQTMGTAVYNWDVRADNKMFRVHNPQKPIVSTRAHRSYGFDEFPNGTNAVVAVISYTGFDMEDAMILNKVSERSEQQSDERTSEERRNNKRSSSRL